MVDAAEPTDEHSPLTHLVAEAATMAFYVAVCLLAALVALEEEADDGHVEVLGLIWGTALGLALAHWFAFRLSARLVRRGAITAEDAMVSAAQLGGAAFVAALLTIPVAILPSTSERDVARLLLVCLLGAVGYQVVRTGGGSRRAAWLYAGVTAVFGLAVAVVKNVLSGH